MGIYDGRVVLIMGGGRGIGAAAARAFAREGAKIALADWTEADGQAVAAELSAITDTMFCHTDVTDEAQVMATVSGTVERFGRIDAAVNIAGSIVPPDKSFVPLHETSLEAWSGTLGVNLTGAFLCMKHQIIQMLKQGGGAIVNTASVAGQRITPGATYAYHAAKAGLIHLSRTAAVKYGHDKIRVNVVAPGVTATELVKARIEGEGGAPDPHPIGRLLAPEEVAAAYLWLCSDSASGVTGITVPVDGGWTAG